MSYDILLPLGLGINVIGAFLILVPLLGLDPKYNRAKENIKQQPFQDFFETKGSQSIAAKYYRKWAIIGFSTLMFGFILQLVAHFSNTNSN